ncbi:hypothetical protein KO465_00760 [Candidatus Micrarchaeota archaeon]|nr:hypothetical protein [Candidatus Micrarchaeota archaeon]
MGSGFKQTKKGYGLSIDKISDDLTKVLWKRFMSMYKENKEVYDPIFNTYSNGREGIVVLSYDERKKRNFAESMIEYNFYNSVVSMSENIRVLDKKGLKQFISLWLNNNLPLNKINDDEFVTGKIDEFLKRMRYDEKTDKILSKIPKRIDKAYSKAGYENRSGVGANYDSIERRLTFGITHGPFGINWSKGGGTNIMYGPLTLNVVTKNNFGLSFGTQILGMQSSVWGRYNEEVFKGAGYSIGTPLMKAQMTYGNGVLNFDIGTISDIGKMGPQMAMMFINNFISTPEFLRRRDTWFGKNITNRIENAVYSSSLDMIAPLFSFGEYLYRTGVAVSKVFGIKPQFKEMGDMIETLNNIEETLSTPRALYAVTRNPSILAPSLVKMSESENGGYVSGYGRALMEITNFSKARNKRWKVFAWPPFQNAEFYEMKKFRKRIEKAMDYNKNICQKIDNGEKITEKETREFKANITYLSHIPSIASNFIGAIPHEMENILTALSDSVSSLKNYVKKHGLGHDKTSIDLYNDGLFFQNVGYMFDDKDMVQTGTLLLVESHLSSSPNEKYHPASALLDIYSEMAYSCNYENECIEKNLEKTSLITPSLSSKNLHQKIRNVILNAPLDAFEIMNRNRTMQNGIMSKKPEMEDRAHYEYIYLSSLDEMGLLDLETKGNVGIVKQYYEIRMNSFETERTYDYGSSKKTSKGSGAFKTFSLAIFGNPNFDEVLSNLHRKRTFREVLELVENQEISDKDKIERLIYLKQAINYNLQIYSDILKNMENVEPQNKKERRFLNKIYKRIEKDMEQLQKNKDQLDKEISELQHKA